MNVIGEDIVMIQYHVRETLRQKTQRIAGRLSLIGDIIESYIQPTLQLRKNYLVEQSSTYRLFPCHVGVALNADTGACAFAWDYRVTHILHQSLLPLIDIVLYYLTKLPSLLDLVHYHEEIFSKKSFPAICNVALVSIVFLMVINRVNIAVKCLYHHIAYQQFVIHGM